MKIEMDECDNCGARTKCYYDEKGWIIFSKLSEILITNGREKCGQAKTKYKSFCSNEDVLMFCCRKCLNEYLDKLEGKKQLITKTYCSLCKKETESREETSGGDRYVKCNICGNLKGTWISLSFLKLREII